MRFGAPPPPAICFKCSGPSSTHVSKCSTEKFTYAIYIHIYPNTIDDACRCEARTHVHARKTAGLQRTAPQPRTHPRVATDTNRKKGFDPAGWHGWIYVQARKTRCFKRTGAGFRRRSDNSKMATNLAFSYLLRLLSVLFDIDVVNNQNSFHIK